MCIWVERRSSSKGRTILSPNADHVEYWASLRSKSNIGLSTEELTLILDDPAVEEEAGFKLEDASDSAAKICGSANTCE